jgi:DNA-directed RNA polymerase subunit M/transcription elongation factor TFIIS
MEQERQLAKNIIKDFIGPTFVESIEKNLFEFSKESKNIYMNKLKYIFEIINPKSKIYNKKIISDIKKKKLTSYQLVYNKPWELYTEHWKDIVEEQNKNDKIVIDKTAEFTTTQFTCSKCKNNECKTYSLQTRSADEPTTIFVNCIKCNNTWKMS